MTRRGMTEVEATQAQGDLDAATELDPATVAALRLVDVLTGPSETVGPELYDELRAHFDEGQILELGAALAVAAGWQRFIEAFGIRPDSWDRSTVLPWTVGGVPEGGFTS